MGTMSEVWNKFLIRTGLADEVDIVEDEPANSQKDNVTSIKKGSKVDDGGSNLVSIHKNKPSEIVFVNPEEFDQVSSINGHLKNGKAVIVNMESIDIALANRIRDFLYGSIDMIDGSVEEINSANIIVVAPKHFSMTIDGMREDISTKKASVLGETFMWNKNFGS